MNIQNMFSPGPIQGNNFGPLANIFNGQNLMPQGPQFGGGIGDNSLFSEEAMEEQGPQGMNLNLNGLLGGEQQDIFQQIKDLENQIKEENEKYLNDVKDIKNNNDEQLKIIKDREDYITKQTDIVFNNLKSVANQNEKAVEALRQENQQLKNQNYTLSKRLS